MSDRIGYKIMPLIDGRLMSGANKNLGEFELRKGAEMAMPGNGIYMSTNREFVVENYSGLADEEVLIAFKFDSKSITSGNLKDKEPEITVPRATIVGFQYLAEGELIPPSHAREPLVPQP